MNKSDQLNELAAALAKAQAEIKNPSFDSANPFFKSKYASLAAVRDAVIPVLAKYGLSVIQEIAYGQGVEDKSLQGAGCINLLLHSSGQWIELAPFFVPSAKADAQGACAAATYARRASLQALCCVVGDSDDDGEAAVGRTPGAPSETSKRYVPKLTKTGAPDPIGPVGEIPDSTAPPAANADPAAGSASLAQGFLNSLAACSTAAQIDGTVKGVVLVAAKLSEEDKAKLREAASAARLRVAAKPAALVDVPNLLREITGLRSQLGEGMFGVILKKHGGEERAGYGLSADKLVVMRDECMKAIG